EIGAVIQARLAAQSEASPVARLHVALGIVRELEDDATSIGGLRRYIAIIYALVYHERSGGLSEKEVDGLVDLASALLRVHGIKPKKSKLASLFGDIHLIRSQILRNEGRPWDSAWEQQKALYLAGPRPS